MTTIPPHDDVPKEILHHPFVVALLEKVAFLTDKVERLEAEIRLLKSHPAKPTLQPSSNLEPTRSSSKDEVKKNSFHEKIEETAPSHRSSWKGSFALFAPERLGIQGL